MKLAVVFLDIDGVLNAHDRHPSTGYCSIDRGCAVRLGRILDATGARIVMTSSWRYLVHSGSMTIEGLRNLLFTHWIDGSRLLGITRRDITDGTDLPTVTDRGTQIMEWLNDNLYVGLYVVMDDMDLGTTNYGHPFIQTDGKVGLTDADASRAIQILRTAADPTEES